MAPRRRGPEAAASCGRDNPTHETGPCDPHASRTSARSSMKKKRRRPARAANQMNTPTSSASGATRVAPRAARDTSCPSCARAQRWRMSTKVQGTTCAQAREPGRRDDGLANDVRISSVAPPRMRRCDTGHDDFPRTAASGSPPSLHRTAGNPRLPIKTSLAVHRTCIAWKSGARQTSFLTRLTKPNPVSQLPHEPPFDLQRQGSGGGGCTRGTSWTRPRAAREGHPRPFFCKSPETADVRLTDRTGHHNGEFVNVRFSPIDEGVGASKRTNCHVRHDNPELEPTDLLRSHAEQQSRRVIDECVNPTRQTRQSTSLEALAPPHSRRRPPWCRRPPRGASRVCASSWAQAPSSPRYTAALADAPLRSVCRASACCGKPYRTAPPTCPTPSLRPRSLPSSTPPDVCLESVEFDMVPPPHTRQIGHPR